MTFFLTPLPLCIFSFPHTPTPLFPIFPFPHFLVHRTVMLNGLRSGKSLAALFGDVFGNVKGSFAMTAEMLIAKDEENR